MINVEEAMNAFKEKFEKMTYEERENFLKEMGFSFGDPDLDAYAQKVKMDFNKLNFEGTTKLLVFLLDVLGYSNLNNDEDFRRNETILRMLYPKINFDYIIGFYNGNVDDKKRLISKIDVYINTLIKQGYTKEESIRQSKRKSIEKRFKKNYDK